MRPPRRIINVRQRRALAERPGFSVGRTLTALGRTREAMVEIEGQLGVILTCLRTPGGRIDGTAALRLASARADASEAMAALCNPGHLFG